MSAWERSRHIPWDRIPQDGSDLEAQRERIFRELQRETIEDELRSQERNLPGGDAAASAQGAPGAGVDGADGAVAATDADGKTENKASGGMFKTKIPYSNMEMLRQAAFGGTIGCITGSVFGFMDGMRQAGTDPVLAKASGAAKGKFVLQGTSRSAAVFGGFFGGFQVVKYGVRVVADPGEVPEILLAGAVSMGALASRPNLRPSMPYAAMLVGMDGLQMVMREFR